MVNGADPVVSESHRPIDYAGRSIGPLRLAGAMKINILGGSFIMMALAVLWPNSVITVIFLDEHLGARQDADRTQPDAGDAGDDHVASGRVVLQPVAAAQGHLDGDHRRFSGGDVRLCGRGVAVLAFGDSRMADRRVHALPVPGSGGQRVHIASVVVVDGGSHSGVDLGRILQPSLPLAAAGPVAAGAGRRPLDRPRRYARGRPDDVLRDVRAGGDCWR